MKTPFVPTPSESCQPDEPSRIPASGQTDAGRLTKEHSWKSTPRSPHPSLSLSLYIYIYIYIYVCIYIYIYILKAGFVRSPNILPIRSSWSQIFLQRETCWMRSFQSTQSRGWRAVSAAALQGEGSRGRGVLSPDTGTTIFVCNIFVFKIPGVQFLVESNSNLCSRPPGTTY